MCVQLLYILEALFAGLLGQPVWRPTLLCHQVVYRVAVAEAQAGTAHLHRAIPCLSLTYHLAKVGVDLKAL